MQLTEQQLKALDLQRHIVVTAGAGSGKTTVLVERYVHILLSRPNASVHQILAITYTDKAAAEMKERVVRRIYELFDSRPESRARLFQVMKSLSSTQISTIHAFCRQVLKNFSLEAGLSPQFEVADDLQMRSLFNRVFWEFFYHYQPASDSERQWVMAAMSHLNPAELKGLFWEMYEQRASVEPFARQYARLSPDALRREWAKWKTRYYQQIYQTLQELQVVEDFHKLVAQLPSNASRATVNTLVDVDTQLQNLAESVSADALAGGISGLLNAFFTKQGTPRKQLEKLIEKASAVKPVYDRLLENLEHLREDFIFPEESDNQEQIFAEVVCGLSHLFTGFLDRLEEEKRQLEVLDFTDLLIRTRDLFRQHPNILQHMRQRYPWILVDEFQDTDELQAEIIGLLAGFDEKPTDGLPNVFIVGDPKQSIYGFRRAEVALFMEFQKRICQRNNDPPSFLHPSGKGSLTATPEEHQGKIQLPHNFRSVPPLIDFLNAAFRRIFDATTEFDVPFSPLEAGREAPPDPDLPAEMHLLLLENTLKSSVYLPYQMDHLVKLIQGLVADGKDRETARRVNYGDIAILIRGRNRLPDIEQALMEAGIPYEVYKGAGFYQKPEVQDMFYLMKSLYQPEDDFALVTALRTPYVGLSDEALFYLRHCQGATYFQKAGYLARWLEGEAIQDCFEPGFVQFLRTHNLKPQFREEDRQVFLDFWKRYRRWVQQAPQLKFSQLLSQIIEDLHVRPLLVLEAYGRQKLANLDKLLQFVYQFEQTRSQRVSDFLQAFYQLITGEAVEGEAVVPVEEGNRVKIMTIHAAKGLEFPVVIIPLLESGMPNRDVLWFHKQVGFFPKVKINNTSEKTFIYAYFRQLSQARLWAEEKRILYVATTRARERLYLLGSWGLRGRNAAKSHLQMVLQALDISPGNLNRVEVENHLKIVPTKIDPSKAVSETGGHPPIGHQQSQIGQEQFRKSLPFAEPLPVTASYKEYSATQLMIFKEDPARYVRHFYLRDGIIHPPLIDLEYEDEPGGLLWGTLVHRLLQDVHLRAPEQDVQAIQSILWAQKIPRKEHSRLQQDLLKTISNFRQTALGRWLMKAAPQYAELRVKCPLPSGTLVGIFDRLFRNSDGHWEVVDFKTNQITAEQIPEMVKKYTPQVRYYALLLSELFPEQEQFPVQLYFLRPQRGHRVIFTPDDMKEISREVETTICQLQDKERHLLEEL